MPENDDVTKAIEMFKGLPEDRQASLLQQMTPGQKVRILNGLKVRSGPAPSLVEGNKAVMASEMEKAQPGSIVKPNPNDPSTTIMEQPGTFGSRAREAAINVLNPVTIPNLLGTAKSMGSSLWQLATQPANPTPILDLVGGMAKAAVEPVISYVKDVKAGNYENAAGASGRILSQTVPAIEGGVKAVKGAVTTAADAGALGNKVREFAQNRVGANALKTTEPTVEKYNEAAAKTPALQAEADTATVEKNRLAQEAAAKKTADAQSKIVAKNEAGMNEADIETEQMKERVKADNARMKNLSEQKIADVAKHNENVLGQQNRARSLDSNLREGSEQLGKDIVDLGKKLREEGNQHYSEVRSKLKDDPGVPLADMAEEARKAEGMLKGSPENIRTFRDLVRKGSEEEGAIVNGQTTVPGDPLYEMLKSQGALDTGGTLPFDELQGYSSEIGRKIASGRGEIPGDVYQALKYLKEKIDAAKTAVAERNGAGAELKAADNFWSKYQDAFYDKDSAVADVRKRVGVLDPEFYSEPFTKGKAAGVGASKLRDLPTQYSDQAKAVADAAERLKAYYAERKAIKPAAEKPIPTAAAPNAVPPRAMATLQPIPEPVAAETVPRKIVAPPEAPTAERIVADKQKAVLARGQSLGELHRGTAFEVLSLPLKSLMSNVMKRPAVVEWIARPTAADLAAIEKLPEPLKAQLRGKLQQVITEESAAGKQPTISPAVGRFLGVAGNVSGGVKNRREALETLGQPVP